jgi:hypothetical protein
MAMPPTINAVITRRRLNDPIVFQHARGRDKHGYQDDYYEGTNSELANRPRVEFDFRKKHVD